MPRPKVMPRGLLWSLIDVSLAEATDDGDDPLDPRLHPLMGADPCWRPALEAQRPDAGLGPTGRCSICKGAIAEADAWVCLGCQSVAPTVARRLPRCRPRPRRPKPVPRGRNRLSRIERQAVLRCAEGAATLALLDARDAGSAERAAAIERAFALYQSGDLSLDELNTRAGTTPGVDPRRRAARQAS